MKWKIYSKKEEKKEELMVLRGDFNTRIRTKGEVYIDVKEDNTAI